MDENQKTSDEVQAGQNKKYFIIMAVVFSIAVILMVTFIMPKEDPANKDRLSRNAKAFDVTSKIEDKSAWMHRSERLLNDGLKEIKASTEENQGALSQRLAELEAKAELLEAQLQDAKKQEQIAKTLLEKVNGEEPNLSQTVLQDKSASSISQQAQTIATQQATDAHQQWARPTHVVNKKHLPSQKNLNNGMQVPVAANVMVSPHSSTTLPSSGIFSISLNLAPKNDAKKSKFPTTDEVIPAGSFARGILLNGIDVSTGDFAKKHPSSMVIRLVHPGSLPNEVVGDMKDCRVTASAFGHRSNERAEIRVERLVCVQEDKSVITTDIAGYVVGADGKQGVRGKIVRRGAEQLWQGMIGQGLSSMAKAVSVASGTSSVSPQGVIKSFDGKEAVKSAGYAGASGALDRFAEQAIKELDEIKPVIQVSAGLPVDVVFLETNAFGEKKEEASQAADIITEQVSKMMKEE